MVVVDSGDVLGVGGDSHDDGGGESPVVEPRIYLLVGDIGVEVIGARVLVDVVVVDRRYRVAAFQGDAVARVAGDRVVLDRR